MRTHLLVQKLTLQNKLHMSGEIRIFPPVSFDSDSGFSLPFGV
jgi:hypothetical protein